MTRKPHRLALAAFFVLSASTLVQAESPWPPVESFRTDLTAAQQADAHSLRVRALALEAYLWGLPPFLHFRQATEFKMAREVMSPEEEPFGGWILVRDLSTPAVDNVMPNVDTLYGASYVHLGLQGPVVLSLPEIKDRYFSVALHDAYFNSIAVLGTPEDGGKGGTYLVLPPDARWDGTLPEGIDRVIEAPTPLIAIFQRIYVRDAADVETVRALQDQIQLYPYGGAPGDAFPRIETPEFSPGTMVRQTTDPIDYFRIVNAYTGLNPPATMSETLITSFAAAGLGPKSELPSDATLLEALRDGATDARIVLDAEISRGPFRDGWRVPDPLGAISGPYILPQAVLQMTQIGSLPLREVAYFVGRQDGNSEQLDGRNHYTLTFPTGGLPPISDQGFWSLTLYKASDTRLYPNAINRYIIRPSTPGLTYESDGSLTIHLAHERPQDAPEGNWLPTPEDEFIVALRAYLPQEPILNGTWFPPAVKKVD